VKFKIKRADNGEFYWTCVAANGETLSTSETYKNRLDAEHAIKLVKALAANAPIEDETSP
jgi:uncharacterized protein YegP (UPF0339 family)